MGFGGAQGLHTASPGCKWRDLDWNRVVQLEGSQVLGVILSFICQLPSSYARWCYCIMRKHPALGRLNVCSAPKVTGVAMLTFLVGCVTN